ncbi:N-acetylmuramoyl-L-alanine amidase [Nocardioides marinquilinus]|uniref:N-acetylmuramoyl-L-alanine amidase n=1 Tax=Nocardioides marinquilinus TaxID=1210400 RepID=A0ABP9Q5X1_9ACTN
MRVTRVGLVAAALVTTAAGVAVPAAPTALAAPTDQAAPAERTARLAAAGEGLRSGRTPVADGDVVATPGSDAVLLAVTWRGRLDGLRLRTRDAAGDWTPWREPGLLADGPDAAGSDLVGAARVDPVRGSDLLPVADAAAVQVDVLGPTPRDLTLVVLAPEQTAADRATTAARPTTARRGPASRKPAMRTRADWGANPRWRSGAPRYNRTIRQVHVHHTVNGNDYTRAEVPGLLRAIYRYHTQSLGWSDIGYNFVVDRFGRTWVGRAGGAWQAVQGAHTLGFNSTSTGVAVLGTFEERAPRRDVLKALARLAAWKLYRHQLSPRGRVRVRSEGSDLYAAGRVVRLPAVDGHRDTSRTACPGEKLYAHLDDVRRRATARVARWKAAR